MTSLPIRRWKLLGYKPNKWAVENVHGRQERFGAFVTCRQCGKTWAVAAEIDEGMEEPYDELYGPPHVGLISYDYKRAELSVNRYLTMVKRAFGDNYISYNQTKHQAVIPATGATLTVMSADDPDAGIGFTFSKLIIDEGQRVPDVNIQKIFPALNVRHAKVRAFGTPDITPDQTWFKGMWMRGRDGDDANYCSFSLTAYENPWISLEEIEHAKDTEPERLFRMLYMAEWVDDEGQVFRDWQAALLNDWPKYNPNKRHVMAVDLAVMDDFTVVMIGEEATRRIVYADRWNRTQPSESYDRLWSVWEKYGKPKVAVDATGLGGIAMSAELAERGMRLIPIKFSSKTKMNMVAKLQGALEHGRIRFAKWEPLENELRGFVYKQTPSGQLTAEAAYGYHDDCVSTLMMLNEAMKKNGGGEEQYDYTETRESPIEKKLFRIII